MTTAGITNSLYEHEREFEHGGTSSVSWIKLINIGSRDESADSGSATEGLVKSYLINVASYARGGFRAGQVTGGSDETAVVEYDIVGTAKIPPCDDPARCDTLLILWSGTPHSSSAEAGLEYSITLKSPSAEQNVHFNDAFPIDRTTGVHEIIVNLRRRYSHKGAAGEWAPIIHPAFLRLSRASEPDNVCERFMPPEIGNNTLDDNRLAEAKGLSCPLLRFADDIMLRPELGSASATSVTFREFAQKGPLGKSNRWVGEYARLLFLRLVREFYFSSLNSQERNSLDSVVRHLSAYPVKSYRSDIDIEIDHYEAVVSAIDLSFFDIAVARLLEGTEVSEAIDPAIARMARELAQPSPGSSNPEIEKAFQQLKKYRDEDNILDVILVLHEARTLMEAMKIQFLEELNYLTIEFAHLSEAN